MTDKEKWMADALKKIEDLYYQACDYKLNRVSSALGMVEDTIMHEQQKSEDDTEDHALATFTEEY